MIQLVQEKYFTQEEMEAELCTALTGQPDRYIMEEDACGESLHITFTSCYLLLL